MLQCLEGHFGQFIFIPKLLIPINPLTLTLSDLRETYVSSVHSFQDNDF